MPYPTACGQSRLQGGDPRSKEVVRCKRAFRTQPTVHASKLSARHLPAAGRSRRPGSGPCSVEFIHASEIPMYPSPPQPARADFQVAASALACSVEVICASALPARNAATPQQPAGAGYQVASLSVSFPRANPNHRSRAGWRPAQCRRRQQPAIFPRTTPSNAEQPPAACSWVAAQRLAQSRDRPRQLASSAHTHPAASQSRLPGGCQHRLRVEVVRASASRSMCRLPAVGGIGGR